MMDNIQIDNKLIVALRPEFSASDLEDLKLYYELNIRHQEEMSKMFLRDFADHPVLGPIMAMQTDEERLENDERSRKLQYGAFYQGDWDTYTEDLIKQGIIYAKVGLTFGNWYEVVKVAKDYFKIFVLNDFKGSIQKAVSALNGISKLIDYAMYAIAESYFIEKNKIIESQKNEQKKLIDDLNKANSDLEKSNHELNDKLVQLKKAKTDLENSEMRFRAIFDNLEQGVQVINSQWKYVYSNKSAAVQGKTSIDKLVGHTMMEVYPGIEKTTLFALLEECMKDRAAKEMVNEFTFPNGSKEWFQLSLQPIPDGVLTIAFNISNRKLAEELKLSALVKQLEYKNKELESFSYTVSHDLRTPLRAIDGFSKVLLKKTGEKLNPEENRYLGIIINNVSRMGNLIDDLLTFSRIGRTDTQINVLDMSKLVLSSFHEILEGEDEKENIKLNVNDLPPAKGDESLLKLVITNLLVNAIKFSKNSKQTIIEIGGRSEKNETIYYVKDNGIGFEMEYASKIFEIFHRLHPDNEFEGTGVGLAISHRIIEKHNGRIWAEAQLNKGATFYFSLPN